MEGKSIATKSRWAKPSKFFPIVVDDFFDAPKDIMEYGKSLPKEIVGDKPGVRSKQLWELDPQLHNAILKKLLSCYYDLDYMDISWKLSNMSFHRLHREAEAKDDPRNRGFIHQDNNVHSDTGPDNEVAGLIYLTPDIDPDSGTSLWNLKGGEIVEPKGESDEKDHNAKFAEKFRFQNFFNRMIAYDSSEWHAANSCWNYDGEDDRLTLAFFIGGISVNKFPLKRIKDMDYEISERIRICG
jgi:hypothetical protein|tara:strand:+ start:257 stop:979 length:723 start_codon:yes stop_codon:yes gene_type:complete